jgi:hypothetical protein
MKLHITIISFFLSLPLEGLLCHISQPFTGKDLHVVASCSEDIGSCAVEIRSSLPGRETDHSAPSTVRLEMHTFTPHTYSLRGA